MMEKSGGEKGNRKYAIIMIMATIMILVAFFVYWHFWATRFGSPDSSGTAGDMFGGLTAIFSGLAFAGLIVTMIMQNEDLRLQRKELTATRAELEGQKVQLKLQNQFFEKQIFETTYFNLVRSLNELVSGIELKGGSRGRDAIKEIKDWYFGQAAHGMKAHRNDGKSDEEIFQYALREYHVIYEDYNDDLGNYFRLLYRIVKFVDGSRIEGKRLYSDILRAQLSNSEVALLLANGLSEHGIRRMKPLIEKYHLLKHLHPNDHAVMALLCARYESIAFGGNSENSAQIESIMS
jgi:hypothetical protein